MNSSSHTFQYLSDLHLEFYKHDLVSCSIRDYTSIPKFTPELSTLLHTQSVTCLKDTIKSCPNERNWIVMTRHMPSSDLIDTKYKLTSLDNDINYIFFNNSGNL